MTEAQVLPRLSPANGVDYSMPIGLNDNQLLGGPPLAGTDVMGLFTYFVPDMDSLLYDDYVVNGN
jgi:hypothetical protein